MKNKGFNWFFPIAVIALLFFVFGNGFMGNSAGATINEEGFFNLAKEGKVKEVVVYTDSEDADVFLTKEAAAASVNKTKQQNALPGMMSDGMPRADYQFKFGDLQYFQEKFDAFKKENPGIKTQMTLDEKGSELQSALLQALMWFGIMFALG